MHTRMTQQFLPEMCPRRCAVECSRPLSVAPHTWKLPRCWSETSTSWHSLHTLRRWEWPVCSSVWQSREMSQTRWEESESCSVMSNSLQSHGLYSPWNSSGQNTGMGSLSLLQGIFPTQRLNPGLLHCMWILYQLSHKGSPPQHHSGH